MDTLQRITYEDIKNICSVLKKDVDFMKKLGLLDYSLLLAVEKVDMRN